MGRLVLFLIFYLFTIVAPIPFRSTGDIQTVLEPKADQAKYRLPTSTIPLSYSISFVVDPNAPNYSGETKIKIKVVNNTSTIVLHSNRLDITFYELRNSNGEVVPILYIFISNSDDHFLTFGFGSELVKDQVYDLELRHIANFGQLFGLYKSSYLTFNGTRRYIALTQLGLTSAREAFPCYDEPALKAIIDLSVYAPNGYFVISNMDVIQSSKPPITGYEVTSFRSTPLMSTYLLAFVVSDFAYKSNTEENSVIHEKEFRIYARPTAKDSLMHALETGQRSIQYLEAFTDVTYRLPKSDHVAVGDFSFGGMENWGVVVYLEDLILYSKGQSTTEQFSKTATLMAHEIAHFWFGDEVSPLWWDYTWLSEGFATFFEQYTIDQIHPNWKITAQFVVNSLQSVMRQDSLPTTNPMTTSVASPSEILNNFNAVAYLKAASVIRMMQHVLGEPRFRLAISNYIKSRPTGVVEPEILYTEMQKVMASTNILPADTTVNDVFGSWANQSGYPVVYVSRVPNDRNLLVLRQERFYQDISSASDERWWIPITLTTSSNANFTNTGQHEWFNINLDTLEIAIDQNVNWFVLNKQQVGYYRVMYDNETWYQISSFMESEDHTVIHELNRAQLIDDAFTFAMKGTLEYKTLLTLLKYLKYENSWIPWIPANRVLSFLDAKMPASTYFSNYRLFLLSIVNSPFLTAGLDIKPNETYIETRFRSFIAPMACKYQSSDCTDDAERLLEKFIVNYVPVDPDLKYAIYCGGVRTANIELWEGLFKKYQNETDPTEKAIFIRSLGCAGQKEIPDLFLNMTASNGTLIINEDVEAVVLAVLNEGYFGVERVLVFINHSFIELRNKLLSNPAGTTRIINRLGNLIVRSQDISSFQGFQEKYDAVLFPNEKTAVQNAMRAINENQLWIAKNMDEIDRWLQENVIPGFQMATVKNL